MIGRLKLLQSTIKNYNKEKEASIIINDEDIKKSWKEKNSKNKIQLKINSEINTLIYMIKETYKINLLYNSNILDFVLLYYNENLSIDNKLKIKKYLLEFNEEYPINRDEDILKNIIQLIKNNNSLIKTISDNTFIEIINCHTLSLNIIFEIYFKYLEIEETVSCIINDLDINKD